MSIQSAKGTGKCSFGWETALYQHRSNIMGRNELKQLGSRTSGTTLKRLRVADEGPGEPQKVLDLENEHHC